ncbi:TPA: hypothetical protein ACUI7D_001986, partial [Klebsiella pneumoniae]
MSEYDTGNPVPSASMPDAWDNMQSIDKFVNSSDETITTRTGEQLDTLHGVNVKADNQLTQQQADFETSQEERDAVVEETRQNLIPLSRQYATLAAAQADIANIPVGSTTYYRSPDDNALAVEVINNAGTLQPTGRKMPSQEAVDALRILITQEVTKIMASGAAASLEGHPDVAWAWVDKEGKSTTETLSDGTTNLAALLLGNKIEFVTDDS